MPNRLVLSLLVVFATDSAALPSLAQTQPPQTPVRHTQPSPPLTCEHDPGDHLLSRFWQRITRDLTLHSPTETERLSELRLRVEDLANKKNVLIEAINGAVAESSLQGWQQTRGKAIPAMQQEISDLTLKIDEEVSKAVYWQETLN